MQSMMIPKNRHKDYSKTSQSHKNILIQILEKKSWISKKILLAKIWLPNANMKLLKLMKKVIKKMIRNVCWILVKILTSSTIHLCIEKENFILKV